MKQAIIDEFMVKSGSNFYAHKEVAVRLEFLKKTLKHANLYTFVLGISGGVDSMVAGKLAQIAVKQLNERYPNSPTPYRFIAVKLPYGIQRDALDVIEVMDYIDPDTTKVINIKESVDATVSALDLDASGGAGDFVKGNIKARQRMIVQYAIANENRGMVIGTDHSAEGVMGFFTKFGDGACDVTPLFGLNKRQVRAVGVELNAPRHIIKKAPTADLEDLNPQLADEVAYGVTYNNIDDFLEGKNVSEEVEKIIVLAYANTKHKRALPKTIYDM